MAGTRTAGAMASAASARRITLRLIDASGDKWAEELYIAVGTANGLVDTWALAYQAATQASHYSIEDTYIRDGDADPDNAEAGNRSSGAQGINMLFKNATSRATNNSRLIAPVPATMQGNSDIPLLSSDELSDLILAEVALTSGFTFREAQFTERRERKNNTKVR